MTAEPNPSSRRSFLAAGATLGAGAYALTPHRAHAATIVTREFSVVEYGGATGDGATDDTAAFQRTIDAARDAYGTVVIPAPPNTYKIASTLTIEPKTGESQGFVNFRGEGAYFAQITYTGTGSVFKATGWKRSSIQNIRIRLPNIANNVWGWDIDGDSAHPTTGNLTFINCDVTGDTPTNCAGFVLGGRNNGIDVSFCHYVNCHTGWGNYSSNQGFVNAGSNSLAHQWFGCDTVGCNGAWSNRLPTGKAGNASMHLFGCNGGYNQVDLQITASEGSFLIHGGRFEHGRRFLDTGSSNGRQSTAITLEGLTLGAYAPSDGIVFNMGNAGHLKIDHVTAYPGNPNPFASNFVRLMTGSSGYGSLQVRGCHWYANDPFYTIISGNWRTKIEGCTKMASATDFQSAGFFTDQ
jgi:hypothetical protein